MELQNDTNLNADSINFDEKIWSLAAYASVLVILPLILKQNSKYCQFHASQGAVLFIASFIILLLAGVWPYLSFFFFIGYGIVSIIAMVKAWKGIAWKIPGIYELGQKMELQKIFTKSSASSGKNTNISPTDTLSAQLTHSSESSESSRSAQSQNSTTPPADAQATNTAPNETQSTKNS
ncbi:hypothetical protein HYV57_00670 [Candidatus Peregrinibacteria bacterium]|nr:hypothetical protein [Candidatus Peregrinibacteria bacterium]